MPSFSTASRTHTCGLVHCTSCTTPFVDVVLLASNIAKEWCAKLWDACIAMSAASAAIAPDQATRTRRVVSDILVVLTDVLLEAAAARHGDIRAPDGEWNDEGFRVRQRHFDFEALRPDAADLFDRRQLV